MSDSIFMTCQGQDNETAMMQCISDGLQEQSDARAADLNDFLYVVAGAMIFFMQAGFAMLCAGCVRLKNVQNTMLKNLLDASGAALAFFLIGELILDVSSRATRRVPLKPNSASRRHTENNLRSNIPPFAVDIFCFFCHRVRFCFWRSK